MRPEDDDEDDDRDDDQEDGDGDDGGDHKPESTDRCDREWASYFRWLSSYLGGNCFVW